VESALTQWARNDDQGVRVDLLQRSDILDRLAEKKLLTGEMREQLRTPPETWPRPTIPRDFCDDSKKGEDLGLERLRNARKVCYGIFGSDFPESSLDATNPALWHERCPEFWLRSDVVATAPHQDVTCEYQAGLLVEVVDLPNVLRPFGPVALTFERTSARDKTWSFVTYKLVNKNAVKVDEGWYLVQRRPDRAHAAIMVKLIEFHRNNDWLDSVCEGGLLTGARRLLGIDHNAAGGPAPAAARAVGQGGEQRGPDGDQDGVLSGVLTEYLDNCRHRWNELGARNLEQVRQGLAEFESRPLRFDWVDNVFGVIENSTSFVSDSASSWADVVQQDLPDALAQAESSTTGRATTSGRLVAAGWRTAFGILKVGSDITRATLQVLGPGIGRSGRRIVDGLDELERSGRLAAFLQNNGVADVDTAKQNLFNRAPRAAGMEEFDADLDAVLRTYADRPPAPDERRAFAEEVWNSGGAPGDRAAGR
jgi:hypothetical protein